MKFLVLQHVAHEHPGIISDYAKAKGIDLQIVELWKPYILPKVEEIDGLIIMGGPMGVYEDYLSKNDEVAFIKSAVNKIPVIGFCLGAQLIAYALGGKVYQNVKDGKKIKEIGYYNVDLTQEGKADPLFKDFDSPVKVMQWHGDTFDLPKEAALLATAPLCQNQAFRFGKQTYALQFHVEFTPQMIDKQIETDKAWIHQDFDLDEEAVKKQARDYEALMKSQTFKLLDNFLGK